MKIYMSFWSTDKTFVEDKIIKLLNVSLYYAKQHYKEINLITDYTGEKFLKDIFNWNSITTELESLPKEYKDVWSLGKIKAYNLIAKKGDPFLHFDSDVFLIKELPEDLLNSNIFCQSFEKNCYSDYKLYAFNEFCINKFYPKEFNIFDKNNHSCPNCGIVGGKDLDFFKIYSETSMNVVLDKENKRFWTKNYIQPHLRACIAEQFYLGAISKCLNKEITTFIQIKNRKALNYKSNEYIHLCGSSGKNDKTAIDNIEYLNKYIINK